MALEDPIGYFALVEALQENPWDPDLQTAVRRTIISRLYYAVFHHIKIKLFGPENDRNVSHSKLRAEAQKLANKKGLDINIKDHLSDFQTRREKSDYIRQIIVDEKFLDDTLVIFNIIKKDCEQIWN